MVNSVKVYTLYLRFLTLYTKTNSVHFPEMSSNPQKTTRFNNYISINGGNKIVDEEEEVEEAGSRLGVPQGVRLGGAAPGGGDRDRDGDDADGDRDGDSGGGDGGDDNRVTKR